MELNKMELSMDELAIVNGGDNSTDYKVKVVTSMTVSGAIMGGAAGAALGSVVPVIGTAVGGTVGAAVGAVTFGGIAVIGYLFD